MRENDVAVRVLGAGCSAATLFVFRYSRHHPPASPPGRSVCAVFAGESSTSHTNCLHERSMIAPHVSLCVCVTSHPCLQLPDFEVASAGEGGRAAGVGGQEQDATGRSDHAKAQRAYEKACNILGMFSEHFDDNFRLTAPSVRHEGSLEGRQVAGGRKGGAQFTSAEDALLLNGLKLFGTESGECKLRPFVSCLLVCVCVRQGLAPASVCVSAPDLSRAYCRLCRCTFRGIHLCALAQDSFDPLPLVAYPRRSARLVGQNPSASAPNETRRRHQSSLQAPRQAPRR